MRRQVYKLSCRVSLVIISASVAADHSAPANYLGCAKVDELPGPGETRDVPLRFTTGIPTGKAVPIRNEAGSLFQLGDPTGEATCQPLSDLPTSRWPPRP